jgi:hypothetical protein
VGGDDGDNEADERVGPGPPEGGIEQEPGEQDRGQVGAQLGLGGIGAHGCGAELAADSALGANEQRHHEQGGGGQGDSDGAGLGAAAGEQDGEGVGGDVGGEGEERHGDEAQRGAFPVAGVDAAVELPTDRQCGEDLHRAVEAESDQRDGPGSQPGHHGDDTLAGVVDDRGPGQPPDPTIQGASLLRCQRSALPAGRSGDGRHRGRGVRANGPAGEQGEPTAGTTSSRSPRAWARWRSTSS